MEGMPGTKQLEPEYTDSQETSSRNELLIYNKLGSKLRGERASLLGIAALTTGMFVYEKDDLN